MRYEPAAQSPPKGGCQSGTRALGLAVAHVFPELVTMRGAYGCYNYRRATSAPTWSLHAEGRALDIGVPAGQGNIAWRLACDLVEHRIGYGTMRVVWDGHIWTTERRDEWQKLQPKTQQHHDHIHVEQFWAAARRAATTQSEMEAALSRGRQ